MLLSALSDVKVYLAAGVTDLRKSYDSLAFLVHERIRQDPLSGSLFVFCNRGRNRIKILYWDGNGYWLFNKRLEQGTFAWPDLGEDPGTWRISSQQFLLMLSGIDLGRMEPRRWYGRDDARRTRRRSA